jgi:hypothetical protein
LVGAGKPRIAFRRRREQRCNAFDVDHFLLIGD